MKAIELIGKQAIRKAPITYSTGATDHSYTNEPVIILKATDTHIIFKHPEGTIFSSDKLHILDCRWNDNNWIDYDELMSGIQ
jgi:hypothetical protein